MVPDWGSAGDPSDTGTTGGGAILTVYRADGGQDKVVLPLARARWKRLGTNAKPEYRYSDPRRVDGPITSILLRNGKLVVRGKSVGIYQLDNAPQGSMAIRLRLGTGIEFCAAAPPKPPASETDTTAKFVGAPGTPPPSPCPVVPAGGA